MSVNHEHIGISAGKDAQMGEHTILLALIHVDAILTAENPASRPYCHGVVVICENKKIEFALLPPSHTIHVQEILELDSILTRQYRHYPGRGTCSRLLRFLREA